MLLQLFIVSTVVASTQSLPAKPGQDLPTWEEWKLKHGKTYENIDEENLRRSIWNKKLEEVT